MVKSLQAQIKYSFSTKVLYLQPGEKLTSIWKSPLNNPTNGRAIEVIENVKRISSGNGSPTRRVDICGTVPQDITDASSQSSENILNPINRYGTEKMR